MIIDRPLLSRPSQFVLRTADTGSAESFYGDLFGWTVTTGGLLELSGHPVARLEKGTGGWLPYLSVSDLDATLDAASAAGAVVTDGPATGPTGRTAVIIDGGGAPLGLWQAGGPSAVGVMGEPGAVVWIEEKTRQQEASTAFLAALFGFEFVGGSGPGVVRVIKGEGPFFGGVMQFDGRWAEDQAPHWLLYFEVGDITVAIDRAVSLGGSLWFPPTDTPLGELAYIRDRESHAIAIVAVSDQGRAMTGGTPR